MWLNGALETTALKDPSIRDYPGIIYSPWLNGLLILPLLFFLLLFGVVVVVVGCGGGDGGWVVLGSGGWEGLPITTAWEPLRLLPTVFTQPACRFRAKV